MGLQPIGYDISGLAFQTLVKTWAIQRQYKWGLMLPHTINGVFGPLISPFCQDVSFGDYSLTSLSKLQYGAFLRFYAGLQDIGTVKLTFVTSVDNAVLDYFQGWYELAIDKEGFYHTKNEYKKDIYVSLFDVSGVESARFVLKGTFVKSRPILNLSYGSDDAIQYNFELSVDTIEMSSIIGAIRGAVTNLVGDVAKRTKEMLGFSGGTTSGKKVTDSGNII